MTATITIPVFAGTWVQDLARPANRGKFQTGGIGMMTAVIQIILDMAGWKQRWSQ